MLDKLSALSCLMTMQLTSVSTTSQRPSSTRFGLDQEVRRHRRMRGDRPFSPMMQHGGCYRVHANFVPVARVNSSSNAFWKWTSLTARSGMHRAL